MKINWLYAACCLSLVFAACSEENNDVFVEENTENNVVVDGLEFKKLSTIELTSPLGSSIGAGAETRGPQDVDEDGRPLGRYPLNYLYLLTTLPERQPTSSDYNKNAELGYVFDSQTKFQVNGPFDLTFSLNPNNKIDESGVYTDAGSAYLRLPDGNVVEIKLSVTEKENLNEDQILMNDLAYDYCSEIGVAPRGASIYYTSYDVNNDTYVLPEDDNLEAYGLWYNARLGLNKGFDPGSATKLNKEFGDKLFVSSELIAFAADDQLYVYEVRSNAEKGYWFQYAFGSGEVMHKSSINMKRLTAAVNASFVLIDGYTGGLTNVSPVSDLLAGLKNMYNVDLSGMECPYATLDGVSYEFEANSGLDFFNCGGMPEEGGHLLLWDDDTENGYKMDNVMYTPNATGSHSDFGLGIRGNAHAFVFPTTQQMAGHKLIFWVQAPVNEDGSMAKVKVIAKLPSGMKLDQNANTQIVAQVPTAEFLSAMGVTLPGESSKKVETRSVDEYATIYVDAVVVE